jgi:hypothetical protein
MYYGAALEQPNELIAHLWVRADDIDVLGCDIADKYTVLMTFSSQVSSQAGFVGQHAPED